MTNTSPVTSAINVLQSEIGFEPFQHFDKNISPPLIPISKRDKVIQWGVLNGISKSNLSRSSLEVLTKIYSIRAYFNAVLREDQNKSRKYGSVKDIQISSNDLVTDLDDDEEDAELKLRSELRKIEDEIETAPTEIANTETTIVPTTSVSSSKIRDLVLDTLKTFRLELKNEITKTNQQHNNDILHIVEKKVRSDFDANHHSFSIMVKEEIQEVVEKESQHQTEMLKKIVEEIIFEGYRNHSLKTSPTEIANNEISNTEIANPSSTFIPKIDPNYHFDAYATKVIRSALSMNENLYVYGDTGCGKTTHLEQVCGVLGRGLVRVNPHDGITREMFLGGMKLINGETIFVEGALPIAMRNGYVILVDEISFLPPNLTAILNPIGEKNGKLYIPETSEWISPAPGFCIFATDNTGGKGDRTGQYTGTEVQNTATLDRFAFCIRMDYLPLEKEKEMLVARFPNQDKREIQNMLSLAKEIRLAFSRGELSITLSTRKLIKFFDQRENGFTVAETLSNTILSWLDEDDETLVKTIIDRLAILNADINFKVDPNTRFDLSTFKQHIQSNELVSAIRELRQLTYRIFNRELGLREAKNIAEAYRDTEINLDEVVVRVKEEMKA